MPIADYYTKIVIAGTDVTAYVNDCSYNDSAQQVIDSADIDFRNDILQSGVSLTPGSEITIQRGIDASNLIYVFRGYVVENKPNTVNVLVKCYNKLWILKQRKATVSFDKQISTEAGKLSAMIITLVTRYGGLLADTSSVQDSGTVNTLNKYQAVNDEVFERVMKLVDALGWQLYYNPVDDKVYAEEFGFRNYYKDVVFNLISPSHVFLGLPQLTYDYTMLINKVTVNGAKQLDTKNETFNGDTVETEFILAYTPLETKVTISGVEQTRGVKSGDTTTFDYWVEDDLNKIVFVSAPATGTGNIAVEYSSMVPIPVVLDDPVSIDTYCPVNPDTGEKTPFEETITYNDLIDVDDAILRGNEYLSRVSTPYVDYIFEVDQSDRLFFPGMKVNVIDEVNGYTGELVVNEIVRKYPLPSDLIRLTDNRNLITPVNDLKNRLENIEKEALRNIGTLYHVKNLVVTPLPIKNRYVKKQKIVYSGAANTGGIYGHPTWGIYGTAVYGAPTSTTTTVALIPGRSCFEEYFYDDEFVDTANTTSTVDTSNFRVIS